MFDSDDLLLGFTWINTAGIVYLLFVDLGVPRMAAAKFFLMVFLIAYFYMLLEPIRVFVENVKEARQNG